MLMNVRLETGLVLGQVDAARRRWRPGMHLEDRVSTSVDMSDGPVFGHGDVVVPSVPVVRMPVREWMSADRHVEYSFHANDASHAEAFSSMDFRESVLAVRDTAAWDMLPGSAIEHVVSPTARPPDRLILIQQGFCPSAWEYVQLMMPHLVGQVRAEWNTRLLSMRQSEVLTLTPRQQESEFAFRDPRDPRNPITQVSLDVMDLAPTPALDPSTAERVRQAVAESVSRRLEDTLFVGLHGTQTGRFSGLESHISRGPEGEGAPPTTTRVYSSVRRALEV